MTWMFSPVFILGATDPTGSWIIWKFLLLSAKGTNHHERRRKRHQTETFEWFLPKNRRWISLTWAQKTQSCANLMTEDCETILSVNSGANRSDWLWKFRRNLAIERWSAQEQSGNENQKRRELWILTGRLELGKLVPGRLSTTSCHQHQS